MIPQKIGPYASAEDVQFEVDATYEVNGQPADLTDVTPHFRMARNDTPQDLVISDEVSPASAHCEIVVESPPTAGVIEVTIAGAHTEPLLGDYAWHCDIVDGNNARTLIARGFVTFFRRLGA